jgi:drug/metabolite transporter (DMT)-like permease
VAALLALLSSLLWGSADFFGGLASRRLAAVLVVGWSQVAGLLSVVVVAAATGAYRDPAGWLAWSVFAGLAGSSGLVTFYTALSIGTMGVVSPIAALGVVVPVLTGLLSGDRPSRWQSAGMVLGLVGALAASGPELSSRSSAPARSVWLAAAAGLAFGVALLGIQRGAQISPVMTLVGMRAASVSSFLLAAVLLRRSIAVPARQLPMLAGIGITDAAANLAFALATPRGLASVVAVTGALYPVATVLLGRFVLGERLVRVQQVGVGLGLGGVVLLAAG